MKFELLNELVENGYDGNDLDELFEFCVDFATEYEELVEAQKLGIFHRMTGRAFDASAAKGTAELSKRKETVAKRIKNAKRLGGVGAGIAATGIAGKALLNRRAKRKAAEAQNESASELLGKLLAK